MSSQAKRDSVAFAISRGHSERGACELIGISRSMLSYRSVRAEQDAPVLVAMKRLAQHYAGHFLANEPERPWMLAARERLRSKLVRLVVSAGAFLEDAQTLNQAIALYQQAIELDPLGEEFYRRLMRVYVRAGRLAEALATYRRCRHMLSVVLGVAPSAETEALRASFGS